MAAPELTSKAQALLQNGEFMQLFQRALRKKGESGEGDASELLHGIPAEGDPAREKWLLDLQQRLQEEAVKEAQKQLEQVHSDENGQWMFILPTPGFCLKCAVAGGGKIFINVCQHERIAEPMPMAAEGNTNGDDKDNSNKTSKGNASGGGGAVAAEDEIRFRIPLSCGQARPEKDKSGRPCKAYDVIVNPATVERCGRDAEFRRFVAALCMQWIKQKYEPTLNADEFRNVNFKAKGTLEPQRIRLSTTPKPSNAMADEIKLPNASATAPRATAASGPGQLIQEITPQPTGATQASAKARTEERVVLASEAAAAAAAEKPTATSSTAPIIATTTTTEEDTPRVVRVSPEGSYDWSAHRKPAASPFFREVVPAAYYVELYIPGIQTIREVDVRVSAKRLECYYVDEVNEEEEDEEGGHRKNTAEPFLSVIFDYPVQPEAVAMARYVKKTALLKLRCSVALPDETAAPRTQPARDVLEEEAEEAQRAAAARREAATEAQARQARLAAEEARVMAERKSYVANLSAVQAGELPPALRSEIDAMPKEQLPAMLQRIEGRVRRQDSIDTLLEKLPEPVLDALGDYLRSKLSLAPRPKKQQGEEAPANKKKEKETAAVPVKAGDEENMREFNYAKKAERLFGIEFHNRYLFALDN